MVIQLTLEFAFQTLAADPGIQTKRITSLPAFTGISPYLALLHAEIARFTPLTVLSDQRSVFSRHYIVLITDL